MEKAMKKWIAATMATMVTASGATTAWAASYQETEQEIMDSFVAEFTETWDMQLESAKTVGQTSDILMELELEEGAHELFTLMTGLDFSWLDSIGLQAVTAFQDEIEGVDLNLLLNGSQVLQFLEYIDIPGSVMYMKLPELFTGSLKMPVGETADAEAQELLANISDPTAFLPDAKVLEEILNRYKDIVIDNMEEGEEEIEAELTVEELTQECTLYEGRIYEDNLYAMEEEILTTARDDEQLKEIIEKIGEVAQEGEMYAQFQQAVEDELASLAENRVEEGERDEDTYLSSRLWINEDGKVVGRAFGGVDKTEEETLFSWYHVKQDDKSALSMGISDGSEGYELIGSGTTAEDDTHEGEYRFVVNGAPMMNIAVTGYQETETECSGSFVLELDSAMEDQETYNMLGAYKLLINLNVSLEDKTSAFDIGLVQNDTLLGTLTLGQNYGEDIEVPQLGDPEPVFDMEVEEDAYTWLESLDWRPLLKKAMDAGVPEELVQYLDMIIQSMLYGDAQYE